jgi:hypothetical protein
VEILPDGIAQARFYSVFCLDHEFDNRIARPDAGKKWRGSFLNFGSRRRRAWIENGEAAEVRWSERAAVWRREIKGIVVII